jgi:hypothetical protein
MSRAFLIFFIYFFEQPSECKNIAFLQLFLPENAENTQNKKILKKF